MLEQYYLEYFNKIPDDLTLFQGWVNNSQINYLANPTYTPAFSNRINITFNNSNNAGNTTWVGWNGLSNGWVLFDVGYKI